MSLSFTAYLAQATVLTVVLLLAGRLIASARPQLGVRYYQMAALAAIFGPFAQPWLLPAPVETVMRIPSWAVLAVTSESVPSGEASSFTAWLMVLWWVGVAASLARLVVGWLGLSRLRAQSDAKALDPSWLPRVGLTAGDNVRLQQAMTLRGPMTFGWPRATVILPASFEKLPDDVQEGILCHELLHVCRRDWLEVLGQEVLASVLWFHPAVWMFRSRIELCREKEIDRRVVEITGRRRAYLEGLRSIAEAAISPMSSTVVPFARRGHLAERVIQLRKDCSMTRIQTTVRTASAAAIGAAALAIVMTLFPLTQAAYGAEGPIYVVEGDVQAPKRIGGPAPEYPETAEKIEGQVVLRVVIDVDGLVDDIEVAESLREEFDRAATAAIRQWEFEAATLEGEPVAVYYHLTVNYRLGDDEDSEDAE